MIVRSFRRRPTTALWTAVLLPTLVLTLGLGSRAAAVDATAQAQATGRVLAPASANGAEPVGGAASAAVSLLLETAAGLLRVTLTPDAWVLDERGAPMRPETIPLGARVQALGEARGTGQFLAYLIVLLPGG